jgi:hypothetical protein
LLPFCRRFDYVLTIRTAAGDLFAAQADAVLHVHEVV